MGQAEENPLQKEFVTIIKRYALPAKLCIWEASDPSYYTCYLYSMQIKNIWNQMFNL